MKIKKVRRSAPLIFIIFGALYGILTNLIFDKLVSSLWTPLAIALYVLVFAILLCLLIVTISKKLSKSSHKRLLRDMIILIVAIFLASMLFEFLYEINTDIQTTDADAYIFLIDDSGSMGSNDPEGQRATAITNLLKDKSSDFSYAVYTFANDVRPVRSMQPISAGYEEIELNTSGGTAMFTCLNKTIDDINSGNLQITSSTRVILLSDGYAGDSPLFKSNVLKKYTKNNIIISTIGLGPSVDTKTMKKIAEYTGGVYIHIDDASMLDDAMKSAAVSDSNRNLLSYRGYCTTNTLHAVLRIVFILMIVALIFVLKIYSYGKYYLPNLFLSGICCLVAALLPEISLELLSWNDQWMRTAFCILISVTLIEVVDIHSDDLSTNNGYGDGHNGSTTFDSTDSLTKKEIKIKHTDSLG